jgi:hypothetical protein
LVLFRIGNTSVAPPAGAGTIRRHKASEAMVYAFDLMEFDGEDLRLMPLSLALP